MRFIASAAILIVLVCAVPIAEAQAAIQFDLPAQPLADSLRAVGSQTNINLLFDPPLVARHHAPALKAQLTADQALSRLLSGTGIQHEFLNEQTVVLAAATRGNPSSSSLLRGGEKVPQAGAGFSGGGPTFVADEGKKGLWSRLRLALNDAPSQTEGAASREEKPSQSSDKKSESRLIEEVVVTAQKRIERLKDVPISIAVLSGEALDRATAQGVTEVLNTVSGVSAQESYIGGGTQVAIRGVSGSSPILHGSSPIAYYLDAVPFGLIKTSVAPDANAYDLERVEVLRGPQGTLYGASALNGVVRILTRDADLHDFGINARASVSEAGGGGTNYRGDVAVNVPIVEDVFGVRAVAGFQDLSGWIDRPGREDVNSAEISTFRFKANAQPTESLSIEFLAAFFRDDREAPSQARENDFHAIDADEPQFSGWDTYGLTFSYDFNLFTLTSATSHLDYENRGVLNLEELTPFLAGREFDNRYFAEVWTQEINITSNSNGPWRWSLGGIYRDAEDRTLQQLLGVTPTFDFNDTSRSHAIYGEATRSLFAGHLELTAGLRYFHDDVGTSENLPSNGIPGTPLVNVDSSFEKVTPRLVVTWLPSDDLTFYASYAEGFRSGFQQQPNVHLLAPDLPPVEADSLENYEVGSKGLLFDGLLSYEAALYYMYWQDVQSDRGVSIAGLPVSALVNGESASGLGFDVALGLHPIDGLDLGISFGKNDLAWDSDVISRGAVLFEEGSRLSMSPRTSASGYLNYSFPIGNLGYQGRFSLSANYTSSQFIKIASGFGEGDSLLIARSSFTVTAPSNWELTLYADNLFDEDGVIQQAPFVAPDWAVRPRPRTIGLQVEYHY